jgi:lipopolysaccharide/colanic/teichoic acid biosynthesis glycosyltransferase
MNLQTPAFERPATSFQSKKRLHGLGMAAGRAVAASLLPVVALLTLAYLPLILLSSNESPIWRQKRVGFHGKDILVPKFSTMNPAADGHLRETWFGRLVRPVGLDEILQIWLIAIGDMQWFGPRPFLRQHIDNDYIQAVLSYTKPGFINSRSLATGIGNRALQSGLVRIEEMIRYDCDDLLRWSPFYAARLFLLTVLSVLRLRGPKGVVN